MWILWITPSEQLKITDDVRGLDDAVDGGAIGSAWQMMTSPKATPSRALRSVAPEPLESPRICADCRKSAHVMIQMEPGRYAPAGVDPRSIWWLCGRCWFSGVQPNKLGNVDTPAA